MWKILAPIILILAVLGGLFYLNQKGKLPLPTAVPQIRRNTTNTVPKTVTSQNVDSTLDQQTTAVNSTMNQVDQDFKEIDQLGQSESDLQGI